MAEKDKDEILEKKLKWWNTALAVALIGIFLTGLGYIIKIEYFDKKVKVQDYVVEKHKSLYKRGSEVFKKLDSAYININRYLEENIGLTNSELNKDKIFTDFMLARNELYDYKKELQKYSSNDFLSYIENLENLINSDMLAINFFVMNIKQVDDKIKNILFEINEKEFPKYSKLLEDKLSLNVYSDIENNIILENKMYLKISFYSLPKLEGIELGFDEKFRNIIGLDKIELKNDSYWKIEDWQKYKYSNKNFHYTFASMRSRTTPQLKFEKNAEILLGPKNNSLERIVYFKYLMSAGMQIYDIGKQEKK